MTGAPVLSGDTAPYKTSAGDELAQLVDQPLQSAASGTVAEGIVVEKARDHDHRLDQGLAGIGGGMRAT